MLSFFTKNRLRESMEWLNRRRIVAADLETAHHYARIVAKLRRTRRLLGQVSERHVDCRHRDAAWIDSYDQEFRLLQRD